MDKRYTLESFIQDLDCVTREVGSPSDIVKQVTPRLQQLLCNPGCVPAEFRRRGVNAYGRYMLHRAPRFNITTIVWGPGDMAKAHNHETWGLVGVLENEIQETRFRRLDDGLKLGYAELQAKEVLRHRPGMVSCLIPPEDDIHEMENVTDRNTVEVHIYGKDLAGLQRLRFDPSKKTSSPFASPKYANC
jgi:predicted metal-dependent enzyme (double-stranded beta helix superfamily)